jgi:hypothetical protein
MLYWLHGYLTQNGEKTRQNTRGIDDWLKHCLIVYHKTEFFPYFYTYTGLMTYRSVIYKPSMLA